LDFEDSDSNDDLNKLEIKIKTGKRNKSKLSVQNTLDTIEHLFNDIPSVSIKELSSDNNEKIVSSRKSLRNRVQHKDTPNRKSVDILFSPSALVNRDDKMATITEIISKDMEDVDLGIKVLRNRTILANNTPKSNRSSKMVSYIFSFCKRILHLSHMLVVRTLIIQLPQAYGTYSFNAGFEQQIFFRGISMSKILSEIDDFF